MSAFGRLVHGQTDIDFTKWWKRGLILSGVLIAITVLSLLTRGLNLGIDFEGGTSWELSAPGVSVSQARDALSSVGEGNAKIQIVGTDTLRVQGASGSQDHIVEVRKTLADLAGVDPAEVNVSEVGPSWGSAITSSAVRALVIFLIVITIYLTIRLEWEMALAAITAMIHDILISVGAYSVFQFEVTPGTVIAFLTILGYSIYDTIVVFDKVKENEGRVGLSGRMTYSEMVSLSMNQVLMRSLNTSITSLLPVVSILVVGAGILGAVTLEEFGIALFVGLISGAYSSIFIAAPVVAMVKERESRFRSIRERVEAARASGTAAPGAPVEEGPADESPETATDQDTAGTGAVRPPTYSGTIPPRPRKKGKRR